MASAGAVMTYDPLFSNMLVTIARYNSLLGGVFHITYVPIVNTFLLVCNWFLFVGLISSPCGMILAVCPSCILATSDIGRSDLAFLAHNSSIGDCTPLTCGEFLHTIRENENVLLCPWLWTASFLQAENTFLPIH